jgi:hypothetical protein
MPTHVAIQPGNHYPQPGYTVQIDKEGKWTATQIFLCHRSSAVRLMPRPGTVHPEIPFIAVSQVAANFTEAASGVELNDIGNIAAPSGPVPTLAGEGLSAKRHRALGAVVDRREHRELFEIRVPDGFLEVQVRASLANFEPGFLLKDGANFVLNYVSKVILGMVSPLLGLVTSYQEQIEWHLRIVSLLVGLLVCILSLVSMVRKLRRR